MKTLAAAVLVLIGHSYNFAQDKQVTAETLFLGADQPTVKKIAMPKYPDSAKGIGGIVSVPVNVAADGSVTVTGVVSGPIPVCQAVTDPRVLSLREAAAAAATRSKFEKLTGLPQDGWIEYRFGRDSFFKMPGLVAGVASDEGARVESQEGDKEMRLDRITTLGSTDKALPPPSSEQSAGDTSAKLVRTDSLKAVDTESPKTVSGGVLKGKAATLPKPSYPPAARALKAGGAVAVQVLIDMDGSVFTAQAVSGHPLLRSASEKAACSSRFMPTLLAGNPVRVSGVITYNYVP